MSGTDANQKRRKRRKTRAERNLSKGLISKPQHDQKQKSAKKEPVSSTASSNHNISYTLRSGAGANAFVPVNYKAATSGTITQDRMTTTYRMLTNSKSSDWIKRGPVVETEVVKKKVEHDLKRILNLADGKNAQSDECDISKENNEVNEASQGGNSYSGAEQSNMEVDDQAASSQTLMTCQAQDKAETLVKNSTSKEVTSKVTPPIGEVPVQEIADKLLKEVKVKFAAMFPNRDSEDMPWISSKSNISNTLSACRPSKCSLLGTSTPTLCHPVSTSTHSASKENGAKTGTAGSMSCSTEKSVLSRPAGDRDSCIIHHNQPEEEESGLTSFSPDNIVMEESQASEPIIHIVKGPSSNSSSDDCEDDNDGGLTAACCDAFLLEARDLEVQKQQHLKQQYNRQKQFSTLHFLPLESKY
ncbi:hypothetical protein PoB_000265500 [Plakobranchus ocellatus]|uniref:Uncharacterized protein n=1 Tax=Plakobranchus ocellatus TaxID=259542 RepID=A0AAV3Y0D5_9GAST|nr:hypothetical protein PoB_000265500 [Plakobranchus ocellatus]